MSSGKTKCQTRKTFATRGANSGELRKKYKKAYTKAEFLCISNDYQDTKLFLDIAPNQNRLTNI